VNNYPTSKFFLFLLIGYFGVLLIGFIFYKIDLIMSLRSEKNRTMFEIFKQEAEFVTMRSDTHTKKFIKWRGKIYQSGSLKSVFSSVKNEIKPK
jgi:hypothetical protein